MASRPGVQPGSELGIPDLIRHLTEDSKRLARDEVRLAKLEMRESLRTSTRGALWLGLAFGAAVVALVAFTFMLAALLGRLLGNYWAGALLTGALDLGGGLLLVKHGLHTIREPSFSFDESRQALRETAEWARREGAERVAELRVAGRGDGPVDVASGWRPGVHDDARLDTR